MPRGSVPEAEWTAHCSCLVRATDCIQWITQDLNDAVNADGVAAIMNVTLVPYGNGGRGRFECFLQAAGSFCIVWSFAAQPARPSSAASGCSPASTVPASGACCRCQSLSCLFLVLIVSAMQPGQPDRDLRHRLRPIQLRHLLVSCCCCGTVSCCTIAQSSVFGSGFCIPGR